MAARDKLVWAARHRSGAEGLTFSLEEMAPIGLQRHWLATRHGCHRCLTCGRPVSAAVGIYGVTTLHGLMAFFSKLLAFQDQLWLQLLHRPRWFFVLRFAFNVALPTLPPAQPPHRGSSSRSSPVTLCHDVYIINNIASGYNDFDPTVSTRSASSSSDGR